MNLITFLIVIHFKQDNHLVTILFCYIYILLQLFFWYAYYV